jgi:thiamine-monophosphate kinase
MDIASVGEFGIIDMIKKNCINNRAYLAVGIGDDAAVLCVDGARKMLVSTDMLAEDVHFKRSFATMRALGCKAASVNLSDIAAMGGRAENLFISLALPKDISVEDIEEFYAGAKEIAAKYKVNIAGGDTIASAAGLVISITATGSAKEEEICLRSSAKAGDFVCATGNLGDSAAGLALLFQGGFKNLPFAEKLIKRHLEPEPQLFFAEKFSKYINAMNDISDGLASEANEIAAASHVRLVLDEKSVPLSDEIKKAAHYLGKDALKFALYGGEDYELVFTIEEKNLPKVIEGGARVIGKAEKGEGVFLRQGNGEIVKLAARGYNHF